MRFASRVRRALSGPPSFCRQQPERSTQHPHPDQSVDHQRSQRTADASHLVLEQQPLHQRQRAVDVAR
jgi:hypothetical protein